MGWLSIHFKKLGTHFAKIGGTKFALIRNTKDIMKKLFWIIAAAALLVCTACGLIKRDRLPADTARLPEGTTVNGQDVSRLTIGEARARVGEGWTPPVYRLRLPDGVETLDAAALGVSCDVNAALLSAVNGEAVEELPLTIDAEAMRAAVRSFAEAHTRAPEDATVTFLPGSAEAFAYTPERTGLTVDEDALYQAVLRAVQGGETEIEVPCSVQEPVVTEAALRQERQLLGSYTTSFGRSPYNVANRVFNICKAAGAIDGTVLEPGETFDCNAVLGDRNEENGWRMAAGIRSGQYVQEYGGGVCQVSSTLFNAVLEAALTITERHPHSWPMGYVDIGRDATISTGGKNFCFVNSTDAPLTLSAVADEEEMTVTLSLYGVPALPEGQYIVVSSEQTGTLPALPDEVLLDESLPYGTRVVDREGRRGRTARTYQEYYAADGTLLRRELAYEDTYRSIAARIYVSTDLYAWDGAEETFTQTTMTEAP